MKRGLTTKVTMATAAAALALGATACEIEEGEAPDPGQDIVDDGTGLG